MIYLSVEKLSKNFPDQPLFTDLTFGIYKGDKIGLVANNGAGKSTLIKVLTGTVEADEGTIWTKEDITVGTLDQDPTFPEAYSIREIVEDAHRDVRALISEYERANAENDGTEAQNLKLASLAHRMEVENAWDYDRNLKSFLSRFKIDDLSLKAADLSGGQRKRVALAITLSKNPNLLILDEPTNHLDIEMIEWLEDFLSASGISLFMVTHDRYFLDTVCNQIIELHNERLYVHQGNYAYFLEKRAEREAVFRREIEKANSMMRGELEWMRRMPQARTTKAKSRIDAFYELADKASTKIEDQSIALAVKMNRLGGKIVVLKNISKQFGNTKLIDRFSYTFKKGDRVGIVGPNGAGKTTFLKLITGKEHPDSGRVQVGETVVFGFYKQDGLFLDEDLRIIDYVKSIAEYIPLSNGVKLSASQFLSHFLFPQELQYKPISRLSGGEKRRLHLLTVLIKNPNFLILDEPTNDLDLITLNKLEEFLSQFAGCLILVSHDRYFMDKLVDHLFILDGAGNIKGYNGTYTEYRLSKLDKKSAPVKETKQKPNRISAISKKEKNELSKLERDISTLENKKAQLEADLSRTDLDLEQITKWSKELGDVIKEIEEKTNRWIDLAEKLEALT